MRRFWAARHARRDSQTKEFSSTGKNSVGMKYSNRVPVQEAAAAPPPQRTSIRPSARAWRSGTCRRAVS